MIRIDKVNFSYGERPTLQDISFEAPQGKIFGIIGPNGSGKTTLLKLLSGVLRSYTGAITLNGGDIRSLSQRDLSQNIAMVPQDSEILFPFTALEIVLMGRAPYLKHFAFESAQDLQIAREAMALTGTETLTQRLIQELSGGERQLVMIARALAQQTPILLLDEPTTHLDIQHQQKILGLVKKLSLDRRLSILITLHDLNHAALICDHLMALKKGQVFAQGTPEEILSTEIIQQIFEASVERQGDHLFLKL